MVTYAMHQVQHWGDVGGPFAHRTTGKHVVAAHADDQNIRMVIDVADYAVAHPSRGHAELAHCAPCDGPARSTGDTGNEPD